MTVYRMAAYLCKASACLEDLEVIVPGIGLKIVFRCLLRLFYSLESLHAASCSSFSVYSIKGCNPTGSRSLADRLLSLRSKAVEEEFGLRREVEMGWSQCIWYQPISVKGSRSDKDGGLPVRPRGTQRRGLILPVAVKYQSD